MKAEIDYFHNPPFTLGTTTPSPVRVTPDVSQAAGPVIVAWASLRKFSQSALIRCHFLNIRYILYQFLAATTEGGY